MHTNRSFDTETVNGEVVVVAYGDGGYQTYPTLDQFLEKMTTGTSGSGRYFTWNIRFDAEAFLKKLPIENINEILEEDGKTIYKNWQLKYFGSSTLIIKNLDRGNVTKVWDLARFYNYLRLAVGAEKYLPKKEAKMSSPVIDSFVGENNTIEYFEKHTDEIVKYCIQDARATRLLADVFEKTCEEQNYDFKNPYSIGNLGIKFFKPYLVSGSQNFNIPRIHPCHYKYGNDRLRVIEGVQELLARGGWNDCMKRGSFEEVWDADIVSAYPYFMRKAPYWDGVWDATDNETLLDEYTYGNVSCEMRNLTIPMLPSVYAYFNESEVFGEKIKWENHSVIWSSVGDQWVRVMLPLPMYKFLRNYADVKFEAATFLKPTEEYIDYFPLEKPIDILFKRKRQANKGTMEYNLAKILMNGTSGKFKQRMHTDNTWFFFPHLYGWITWEVKRKVLELIIKNKLWDDVISVSTDGAVLRAKPSKINVSKDLGNWDLVHFSPFVQVGNGIYYGTEDNGNPIYRLRGFNMGRQDKNLQQWIESEPTKKVIKLQTRRPLHLRECVKHHKVLKVSDVGRFVTIEKRLSINMEVKRNWLGQEFENIAEMLSGKILESVPWDYSVANEMCEKARKRIKKEQERYEAKE